LAVLLYLEQAGYDQSFINIDSASLGEPKATDETKRPIGFQHVRLDEGVRLDMGGIAKGWTVDRAADILDSACDFPIDAGGDIRAAGKGSGRRGWWVAVEDPMIPENDLDYLQIVDSAVATSASYRRKWTNRNGQTSHHLIDPKTGTPSESGVVCATVRGSNAEQAEVVAKAALLAGGYTGLGGLAGGGEVDVCVTYEDGTQVATPGWDIVRARDAVLMDMGV
jgi:thiamine biosynthesis lipoprotein